MSALRSPAAEWVPLERHAVQVKAFGELAPISRLGGQGRVHRPTQMPVELGGGPVVVKLYRRAVPVATARVLVDMVGWSRSLAPEERLRLHRLAAWPLAVVNSGLMPVGIAMPDVAGRFAAPFVMPSGRREGVLLALEHLLGPDDYLQMRGLDVRLDTVTRARVAERISEALGYLHRHAIVVSDVAPSNLLVGFGAAGPSVCFIDCDSMVFRGRQALEPVETGDWNMPAAFAERPSARAADAYKLGLIVLRLFARSHDARELEPHLGHVPAELRGLLTRALDRDAANRPPAGEWQRALSEQLAGGGLGERYPGPASPARVPSTYTPAPPARAWAARAPTARAPAAAAAATALTPRAAGPVWLRPAVVALWLVAGTAVLALILSRLFAAALPSQDGGPSPASFSTPRPAYQFYYNPPVIQGPGAQVP